MEKKRILKNGMPLYSYRTEGTHSFMISLYLRCGSLHESESESGVCHFLEHLSIRNINYLLDGEAYRLLDKHGLDFNATTSTDMVQFYIVGAPKNFRIAAEIFSRLLSPIQLPAGEVESERQRIRAEIRESDERSSLDSFAMSSAFPDSSLSRFITGTSGSISKMSRRYIERYRRSVFTADNLFLYLTGAFSEEDLDTLDELFGRGELYEGEKKETVAPVPREFGNRGGAIYRKNGESCKVRLTFDIDVARHGQILSEQVYKILLGGYSSELFLELSEKRGLIYDLDGGSAVYKNIGYIYLTFEVTPSRLEQALRCALGVLSRMKNELLPTDRLMLAAHTDNEAMLLDDPRDLNFTMAYDNHFLGLGFPDIESRARAYSSVTAEDVRDFFRAVFTRDNLTVAIKCGRKTDLGILRGLIDELL